ncbi:GntR family transcriptional regulator [Amycolatopsis sp. lyj-23]|uniref:GntR family transcriptional regulator n=1 Tax=Amycolatopsis sp. lyj-23 TaxID=2789283 RepID=UPI00397AEFAC
MSDTPAYTAIAQELRNGIVDGTYPPGSTLPTLAELTQRYGVSKQTVQNAIRVLAEEGLAEPVRRRGTVVRAAPTRELIVRGRRVFRDERGYFFDLTAQTWVAIEKPMVRSAPAPTDVADMLETEPGQAVVVRDCVMGDAETGEVHHVSLSYLAPWLVDQLPVLGSADTGPGGIYDRMEDHGLGPLEWEERLGARPPSARERTLWTLAPGTPVLRLLRITRSNAGRVCEVNEMVLRADRYEIGYTLQRATTERPSR